MEPVDKHRGAQLSVLEKAWLKAMQEQHATKGIEEHHAKGCTFDALQKEQQASFLSLVGQQQRLQRNHTSARLAGSDQESGNLVPPNTPQHSFPGSTVLPLQVERMQSLHTTREEVYPFAQPHIPDKRGLVSIQTWNREDARSTGTRDMMPSSIVPPTTTQSALYASQQQRYSHQRIDTRGLVPYFSVPSPPSRSGVGSVVDSQCDAIPPASPQTAMQSAGYTKHQIYGHRRTHRKGMAPSFPVPASPSSHHLSSAHAVRPSRQVTPPTIAAPPNLVHQACELYSQMESIVRSAIQVDPSGVTRRLSTCRRRQGDGVGSIDNNNDIATRKRRAIRSYDYPINIALDHSAPFAVIQLLVDAGSSILAEKDGPEECCALSCALLNKRRLSVISLLLKANAEQVHVSDRYSNYPLHTACFSGACLQVIKLLTNAFPEALFKRNFHGQTPLGIAQRNASLKDEVIDCLQHESFGSLEQDAIHLDENDVVLVVNDGDINGSSSSDAHENENCGAATCE